MVVPRRAMKSGGQLTVAIPPEYRKRLGAASKTVLYWHPLRQGEVVISTSATRKAGKPPREDRSVLVAALEAEVNRLTARLEKQRASLWHEWQAQATMKRLHIDLKGYPALDAINERLAHIEATLAGKTPRPLYAPAPAAPRPKRERPASTSTPAQTSPPDVVAGGDAASGDSIPQAAHGE
jgi:hypothetical protein